MNIRELKHGALVESSEPANASLGLICNWESEQYGMGLSLVTRRHSIELRVTPTGMIVVGERVRSKPHDLELIEPMEVSE